MPDFDDDAFLKKIGRTPYSAVKDKPTLPDIEPSEMAPKPETFGAKVGQGVVQGAVLDPIEAVGQVEDFTPIRFPVPQATRNWANQWRRNVEGSPEGQIGRFGGNLATGAGVEGLLAKMGVTSLPWLARAAIGAGEGALSRPVSSPQELVAQMAGGGLAGAVAGRSAAALRAAAQAQKDIEAKAISTAARAGQTGAAEKYAALNMERTFGLQKPTAAARAQAGQQYATAARDAREAEMEARIAAQAIRMNPHIRQNAWETIGQLSHDLKVKVLLELGKRLPPSAAGAGAGIIAQPEREEQ